MPQHDAFFDTLEMDLQLQQRVQDEQLEEELLARVGAFRAVECACARHGGEFWREAGQPSSYMRAHHDGRVVLAVAVDQEAVSGSAGICHDNQ